jgi:Beta-carotene isomerase D27-like, C-terminal
MCLLQEFFKQEMGLDLRMTPNYEDFRCRCCHKHLEHLELLMERQQQGAMLSRRLTASSKLCACMGNRSELTLKQLADHLQLPIRLWG